MKLFKKLKDGGPLSKVTGYFLIECKNLFSIVLLRFDPGSREAYHTHAFNAWSIIFNKGLFEYCLWEFEPPGIWCGDNPLNPGIHLTPRQRFHKVVNQSNSPVWVLSFRGPWRNTWREYLPTEHKLITLTHNRVILY